MSTIRLIENLSRGEWVSGGQLRSVAAQDPDRGLVHLAAVAPQHRPGINEGAANQALFALAKDHAIWGAAARLGLATASDGWVSVGPPDSIRQAFRTDDDPFGCPVLTPELRIALWAALGLPAEVNNG